MPRFRFTVQARVVVEGDLIVEASSCAKAEEKMYEMLGKMRWRVIRTPSREDVVAGGSRMLDE